MPNHALTDTANESIAIYLRSYEEEIDLSTTHKQFYLSEVISVNTDTIILVGHSVIECPYTFYTIRAGINDSITLGFPTTALPTGEYRTSINTAGN